MKNYLKEVHTVSKMIGESVVFAFTSLKTDKFRAFLSLLGVAIGIFSIVAVFCAVDALKANVMSGLNSFGSDVIYIQEQPWEPEEGDSEYKWWEYRKRPSITEEEYNFLKSHADNARAIVYSSMFYGLFKRGRNSFDNGYVIATSPDLDKVANIEIDKGRNFSLLEAKSGTNVAVLGYEVASALFPDEDPLGKVIKVKNKSTVVIGVIKKQGQSMVSVFDTDNAVIIPLNYGKTMYDVSHKDGMIILAPNEGLDPDEFIASIRMLYRAQRRLKPSQKDNFAINKMTFLVKSFEGIFSVINTVGWVIGGFSLLIGGFGIANIMFVSVKERTNQIGIQKALGAKRYVILTQFLVEAAVLSLAGGLAGVLLVYIISLFMANNPSFPLVLSFGNIIKGLIIALVIGIISGVIPAYVASKLDPVKAINS